MNSLRIHILRSSIRQTRQFSTTRPAQKKVAVLGAAGTLSEIIFGLTKFRWNWTTIKFTFEIE